MSHWNYRLIRHDSEWGPEYRMAEVYYDDEGQPKGWCEASPAYGTSFPEAHLDHLHMADAFNHQAFVKLEDDQLMLETYDG